MTQIHRVQPAHLSPDEQSRLVQLRADRAAAVEGAAPEAERTLRCSQC